MAMSTDVARRLCRCDVQLQHKPTGAVSKKAEGCCTGRLSCALCFVQTADGLQEAARAQQRQRPWQPRRRVQRQPQEGPLPISLCFLQLAQLGVSWHDS